jgi:plastocyanin
MRGRVLIAGGVAVIAGFAVPALAADHTVELAQFKFVPATTTIGVGDTVKWHSSDGGHNVKFPGEAAMPALPQDPATFNAANVQKTFTEPGTYKYYCVAHAANENDANAMVGTIVVEGAGPTPTPTATATPTASPTPEPVALPFVASVRNSPACVTGRKCPGIKLRVRSSQVVQVDGLVERGRVPIGNIHFRTRDGKKTIVLRKVGERILRPGRYTLTLTSEGYSGERKLPFRVTQ